MKDVTPFQQKFFLIFGVIFIWLILGVYFKNEIGVWFASLYYGFSFAGVIIIAVYRLKKGEQKPKVVTGEYIVRKK